MSQSRKPRESNIDLVGQKFGRWTVVSKSELTSHGTMWFCTCDCGTQRSVKQNNLRSGLTLSCGCLSKERTSEARTSHGKSRTPIYTVWINMKARCRNPNNTQYKDYGGRGVKVCDRWFNSFEDFLSDIGEPPTPEHTIDRINNNGDYEISNVRWATREEQAQNKQNSRLVTHNGVTKTISQWAQEYGMGEGTLWYRIVVKELPFEEAVSKPLAKRIIKVVYQGREWTVAELSNQFGIDHGVIGARLARGWPPEEAVTTPVTRRD